MTNKAEILLRHMTKASNLVRALAEHLENEVEAGDVLVQQHLDAARKADIEIETARQIILKPNRNPE